MLITDIVNNVVKITFPFYDMFLRLKLILGYIRSILKLFIKPFAI